MLHGVVIILVALQLCECATARKFSHRRAVQLQVRLRMAERHPETPLPASENFNRTYIMFGLFIVLIFVIQVLRWLGRPIVAISFVLPFLLYAENQLTTLMTQITTSSAHHGTCPYFLLLWCPIYLAVGLVGLYALTFDLNPDCTFPGAYCFGLLGSISLFLVADAIKSFLLGLGIVSFKLIRRGFFGVFVRLFIVVRNMLIMPLWVSHLRRINKPTFMLISSEPETLFCLAYVTCKCFLQLWLLFDFGSAFADYRANGKSAFQAARPEEVTEDCIVCMGAPVEPVKLQCGHVFCYQCAFKWLAEKPTCPLCRAPIAEKRAIEFSDGRLSMPVLFFAF